jgi:hypothetical protein
MPTYPTFPENTEMLNETTELSFRLKPSPSAGVGVFTLHGINKGTHLRLRGEEKSIDDARFITLEEAEANLTLLAFCQWFGVYDVVEEKAGFWTSQKFNKMSLHWYLNHSDTPNVRLDENYEWFANQDIQVGQELTIDYHKL